MEKSIVLLSGGIDSATTLYLAKRKGYHPHCLIFDYGQRHRREIQSAKKIANSIDCPSKTLKISLPWKGSSLLDKNILLPKGNDAIPSTYVPARNIIFLSFALSFAEAVGAKTIFIGANAVDFSGYPDCRPEFYRAFRKVISTGTKASAEKKKIKIKTPLIHKTKAQIIRLAVRLRVPFKLTWSCYKGGRYPCGRCDSCYFRQKGFREADIEDPLLESNEATTYGAKRT